MRQRGILCIDDDSQSLAVRKTLLECFDFRVTTATNGREGLKLLRANNVDAVVVDYQMPGMDGGQVARAVKNLRPDVPVLVLSALPWLPQEAPRECIDGFITKGEPTSKLVREIERLLDEVASRQPAKEKMRAARTVGIVSGIVVERLRGLLPKPKPAQSETSLTPLRARTS